MNRIFASLLCFFINISMSVAYAQQLQSGDSWEQVYAEAGELEKKGSLSEAIVKYEKSLKIAQQSGKSQGIGKNWIAIGKIKTIHGEYSVAMKLFEDARKLGVELEDKWIVGEALVQAGDVLQKQSQNKEAMEKCQKALEIGQELKDERILAAGNKVLGNVHRSQGNLTEALMLHQKALEFAENTEDPNLLCTVLVSMGSTLRIKGSLNESIEHQLRASRIAEEAGLKVPLPYIYNELALVYKEQGLVEEALDYHARALKIAEEIGDKLTYARTLNNLGIIYWEKGAFDKAIHSYHQALKFAEELGSVSGQSLVLNNIGVVYDAQGLEETALPYYERSLRIAEKTGDKLSAACRLINIGGIYDEQGKYEKAVETLERSLSLALEIGDQPTCTSALYNLGDALLTHKFPEKAESYFQRALQVAKEMKSKRLMGLTLEGLGRAYLDLEKFQQALTVFEQSLQIGREIITPRIVAKSTFGLARTYEKLGNFDQALRLYESAIEEIENVRLRGISEEAKVGILSGKLNVYESLIQLFFRLDSQRSSQNLVVRAFEYSERARARALLDSLAEEWSGIRKDLTKEQIIHENAIQRKISKIQSEFREAISDLEKNEINKKLEKAEGELDQLILNLRMSNPEYTELKYPEPYNLRKLRKELDKDTALMEFFVGEDRSYVFVVTSSGIQWASIPGRVQLEEGVRKHRETISRPPQALIGQDADRLQRDYEQQAHSLYEQLVKPMQEVIAGKQNLILVLDGVLHYLPFETLLTNEDDLLIQDFTISYAPSATIWANLRTRTKPPNKKELAAFADPVLNTDSQNPEMSETSSNYHLQRLRYSRNEVQAIASLYPKDLSGVYLAQDATEAKFKSERISDYKVIHFATHAVIDEQIPRRSGVILSPDEKNGGDGILQLYELRNLNLNAQLVVLSACQTGLGKLVKGEGIVGLMRAFFSAGARNVVVSLWNVDDKSTAELMKNFYKYMKSGKSQVESLRMAKLDLLQSAQKGSGYAAYKSPYYWSPFVLVGSGE